MPGKPVQRRSARRNVPVSEARHFLEPGPIVLLSSHWQGRDNVMTLGWHTVLEFSPSLLGCMISSGNHSFEMVRRSGECVINLPTTALTDVVVGIGNCSGADTDKFERFGLERTPSAQVSAPRIAPCHAHFECRLHDDALVERYNFFIFEIVEAQAAVSPKTPELLHYTGNGVFRTSSRTISRKSRFRPDML